MHNSLTTCLLASLLGTIAWSQEEGPTGAPVEDEFYRAVDYGKIERKIDREPTYVADPLHALFLFGPSGQARMWAVLDRSKKELPYHDVLYFDLNANGNLTDAGERFTAKYDEERAKAGMAITFKIAELPVPGTDWVHESFRISTVRKKGRKGIFFVMKWRGREDMSGGYGLLGSDVTRWTGSARTAPIIRPNPMGPLSFATWGDEEIVMPVAGETHVNVVAGNRGSGPDTLAVVDENFIDLEVDALWVTVIGRDEHGKEVRARSRITEHC